MVSKNNNPKDKEYKNNVQETKHWIVNLLIKIRDQEWKLLETKDTLDEN